MEVVARHDAEPTTLRWGGVASMLGAVLFLVVFVVVGVVIGDEPVSPEQGLAQYPDIRVGRTIEDGLYLVVLLLWVPLYLVLGEALRAAYQGMALFGSRLGVVGLAVLVAGALPHVVYQRLSDALVSQEADPATLAVAYEAVLGIVDMFVIAGLVAMLSGVLLLGLAMVRAPTFGAGVTWTGVVAGAVGLLTAVWAIIDPLTTVVAGAVFALIIFHLVAGWTLVALARATARSAA